MLIHIKKYYHCFYTTALIENMMPKGLHFEKLEKAMISRNSIRLLNFIGEGMWYAVNIIIIILNIAIKWQICIFKPFDYDDDNNDNDNNKIIIIITAVTTTTIIIIEIINNNIYTIGEFGIVYKAHLVKNISRGPHKPRPVTDTVAVKTLKGELYSTSIYIKSKQLVNKK